MVATFLLPGLFVFLWSTGFIGATFADPYAEPLTTLTLRFMLAVLVFAAWVIAARAPWPNRRVALQCFAIGALLHGIYLGGVFVAIDMGLPSGPSAMIVSIQPILTALFAVPFASERLTITQWIGIIAGFFGVLLVLLPKLSGPDTWPLIGILFNVGALIGITLASPWQKRIGASVDPRTGGVLQYLGGFAVVVPFALWFETNAIQWTPEFVFAIFWMVFVLSLGAVSLLMHLIASGALVKTISTMYLVPAVTAIIAFFAFNETLSPVQIFGFVVSAAGVALVAARGRTANQG
ncbi:MAG: DMT family transporter [Pseudomonadota bacterium]